MENRSVYVLEYVLPLEHETDENKYSIDENGYIICDRETVGIYDDITKAEKDIQLLIKTNESLNTKWGGWTKYFAFILTERYINDSLYDVGNYSSFESIRTYLGNGELNCFSDYDERCVKKFIGRIEPQKFVKDGDFCLLLQHNKICPILLSECSPTIEKINERFPNGYVGDFTDDSGLGFIDGYGHIHPFSPNVFPASNLNRYAFTEELKTNLREEYYLYMNGNL